MAIEKKVRSIKISKSELFAQYIQSFGWALTDIDSFQWDSSNEQLVVTRKEESA